MWGQGKKAAFCKPRGEAQEKPNCLHFRLARPSSRTIRKQIGRLDVVYLWIVHDRHLNQIGDQSPFVEMRKGFFDDGYLQHVKCCYHRDLGFHCMDVIILSLCKKNEKYRNSRSSGSWFQQLLKYMSSLQGWNFQPSFEFWQLIDPPRVQKKKK